MCVAQPLTASFRGFRISRTGYTIPKDFRLRVSDWSRPLTAEQIGYAATDAAVSLFIFQELLVRINASSLRIKLDRIVDTYSIV